MRRDSGNSRQVMNRENAAERPGSHAHDFASRTQSCKTIATENQRFDRSSRRLRCTARGEPERITVCHCTWCQRRTGTAFGVEAVFQQDRVDIAADALSIYRHISDESGHWPDQQFCPACGTNIGITLESRPGIRTYTASLQSSRKRSAAPGSSRTRGPRSCRASSLQGST
ncbi:MAG: GFA family protein [Dongiaceae bacterium]